HLSDSRTVRQGTSERANLKRGAIRLCGSRLTSQATCSNRPAQFNTGASRFHMRRPPTPAPARKENNMAIRDLIPWNKNQLPATGDAYDPFVTFHREMNRLFDDVFRGLGNFGSFGKPMMEGQFGWPRIELDETDKAVTVSAELPGLSEKDVEVEIANGVLSIRGEKRAEHDNGG